MNEPVDSLTDIKDIYELLTEAAKCRAPALLSWDEQELIIKTSVSLFDQATRHFILRGPNAAEQRVLTDVLSLWQPKFYQIISLPQANLLMQASLDEKTPQGLIFNLPAKIIRLQRRKHSRYKIPAGYVLRAGFTNEAAGKESIQKRLFDISASGMSFLIHREERNLYLKDQVLLKIAFMIRSLTIYARGVIRYTRDIPDTQECKVGVEFLDIHENQIQTIEDYVLQENSKNYTRYL